ncbi:AAA family ATPase [Actinokineospora inagensis]|uniref:nSTAND1 domain-containing NTPase n=1 Tax=Actinokineospora inagensis TaxID=103730 RepID=UPI000411201C|nr:AAA family ATPase [Actinokineospora inagensis]
MNGPLNRSGPRAAFAERFARLYVAAGDPPITRVANAVARARRPDERGGVVRVSNQRVSDWRRGRNVPARFSSLAAVLEVLVHLARARVPEPPVTGLYEIESWRVWWKAAQSSPAVPEVDPGDESANEEGSEQDQATPVMADVCPYRGLAVFEQDDEPWYFGRERSTAALLARLGEAAVTGEIVMLTGASGSGKSSLIRAGLLPAIARGEQPGPGQAWSVVELTPGADPVAAIVARLPELPDLDLPGPGTTGAGDLGDAVRAAVETRLAATAASRLVIVVDQFEEVFTQGADEARRRLFIDVLAAACSPRSDEREPRAVVLLGVRTDYYGRCLDYPALAESLDRPVALAPMTAEELREAVTRPAEAAGLRLEGGLVDLLLHDVGVLWQDLPGRVRETGALPLLSHTLLAVWQDRTGDLLTVAAYRQAGGVRGAVAVTAEQVYARLAAAAQAAARSVLLRLVRVNPEARDTRRDATRGELVDLAADPEAAATALEALVAARLVTLDATSVGLAHEAVLNAWPRLRGWVAENRAGILAGQRLEDDAAAWADTGGHRSMLYSRGRLEIAQTAARPPAAVTDTARRFLRASVRHRQRTAWLRRAAVALLAVLTVVSAVTASMAIRQRDEAAYRQLLVEADRVQQVDSSLSAQLDLAAYRLQPDDETARTRLLSTQNTPLATSLTGHTGAVYLASFSPDGHLLASAGQDGTVRLWDVRDPRHPRQLGQPLTGHRGWVSVAAFTRDGKTLVTAGEDHTIRLWDVTDPQRAWPLGPPVDSGAPVYVAVFSPDGALLATANDARGVRVWRVRPRDRVEPVTAVGADPGRRVRSVAFSPDGATIVAGTTDGAVQLWGIADLGHPVAEGSPTGHTDSVQSMLYSPDGQVLASSSADKTIRLWDVRDPHHPVALGQPLASHARGVWALSFSPDGEVLASGSSDSTARLWNVTDPTHVTPIGQPLTGGGGSVFTVRFSPDGRTLATGDADNTLRLWSLPTTPIGRGGAVLSPVFNRTRQILATAGVDRTAQLWDYSDPPHPRPFGPSFAIGTGSPGGNGTDSTVALNAAGTMLATSASPTVQLWDIRDPANPVPVGPPVDTHARRTHVLAFSPDGGYLVTGGDNSSARLWDIRDPKDPRPRGQPMARPTNAAVNAAAFRSDGRTLALVSSDRAVQLWDVSVPDRPAPLGPAFTEHAASVSAAAFSPDGRTLATAADDKTVRLWDTSDPAHTRPVGPPLSGPTDTLNTVAFSPDGQTIAAAGAEDTVHLWTVGSRSADRPITTHSNGANSVTFGPGDNTLITGSGDDVIRRWDLDPARVAQQVCASTDGRLTVDQWRAHVPQLPYEPPCG